MQCYCCLSEISLGRKVKLRSHRDFNGPTDAPGTEYEFYRKEMTYCWSVVCLPCYRTLDNYCGVAEIGAKLFNIAGQSRGDKAAVLDEAKY